MKHHLQPLVPDDFATVLNAVCAFADPVRSQCVDDSVWHADRRVWRPPEHSA